MDAIYSCFLPTIIPISVKYLVHIRFCIVVILLAYQSTIKPLSLSFLSVITSISKLSKLNHSFSFKCHHCHQALSSSFIKIKPVTLHLQSIIGPPQDIFALLWLWLQDANTFIPKKRWEYYHFSSGKLGPIFCWSFSYHNFARRKGYAATQQSKFLYWEFVHFLVV